SNFAFRFLSNQTMNKSAVITIVGAVVCALAIWQSARVGFARTQAMNALVTNGTVAAERSARMLPNDAEVHAARGIVLQHTENYADACRELERAVQLRPRDYFLWLMLGVTRDLNDDQQCALTALRESVSLAPFYAKPRWQIGNLLLRMGQTEEAFKHLRLASETDPSLVPNVIDLAWGISQNDPAKTVTLVQPQSDGAHMSLAIFLAAQKQAGAAIEQFRAAKSAASADADPLIQRLIESRSFNEAFEVWVKEHCESCRPGTVVNGGFEADIDVSERGFGWQMSGGQIGRAS